MAKNHRESAFGWALIGCVLGCSFTVTTFLSLIGSAKTDPVRFKWGFGEVLLKDKFPFFEASKNPIPRRRNLLAKRPFLLAKMALFERPFKLDRVSFLFLSLTLINTC